MPGFWFVKKKLTESIMSPWQKVKITVPIGQLLNTKYFFYKLNGTH